MLPLAEKLSGEGLSVMAPDFPGHGNRTTDQPFSMALFADSILEILDQAKAPKADIFGYSMGGYAALHFARQYPDRVSRIFTLGTKLDWTPETAAREVSRLNPEKMEEKIPAFAAMLAHRHADWKDNVRRTAALLQGLGDGQALTEDDFKAIACPVILGLGDQDNMVTEHETAHVAFILPNGHFERLADTPHPWEQVNADRIAERLRAFFS